MPVSFETVTSVGRSGGFRPTDRDIGFIECEFVQVGFGVVLHNNFSCEECGYYVCSVVLSFMKSVGARDIGID